MKREFLQQCQPYKPGKHDLLGWLASEKLDGQRAFWDGGLSRGLLCSNVPWANTTKDRKEYTATGLWTRYGKPIFAPEWFLNMLPSFPLDGELWAGRGRFQTLRSIVSPDFPDSNRWKQVQYRVFNAPTINQVCYDGEIDITNFYKNISGCEEFILSRGGELQPPRTNWEAHKFLTENLVGTENLVLHSQFWLTTQEDLDNLLSAVLAAGGEGIVAIHPASVYKTSRHKHSVKIKPYHDAEAKVVGYITGRETEKGSKLLGLMGALTVEFRGKRFQLSGFTDAERVLKNIDITSSVSATEWAIRNPETECPSWIEATMFPRGSIITFRYRELTDSGLPKEASYMRKWEGV